MLDFKVKRSFKYLHLIQILSYSSTY